MNNMTENNTITIIDKISKRSSDLDYNLNVDIIGQKNVDSIYNADDFSAVNFIDNRKQSDSAPIKIKELKKIISKLEKDGSNYVMIDYNCDHIEFIFYGLDIHLSTKDEINEYNNRENVNQLYNAEHQLEVLNKQRDKILNEIENLKK